MSLKVHARAFIVGVVAGAAIAGAQAAQAQGTVRQATKAPAAAPGVVVTPPDYVLGPDDVVEVSFRREKDLSAQVVVRPDGKISLPLLNDVYVAGLTPEQARARVTEEASKLVENPSVTLLVKEVHSRKVYITGQVLKPGAYSLTDVMNVMQLIAIGGGLTDIAKPKDIVVLRYQNTTSGRAPVTFHFNYRDVIAGRNMQQNIDLKPGDTVIVP